jgi:hypothetical protein
MNIRTTESIQASRGSVGVVVDPDDVPGRASVVEVAKTCAVSGAGRLGELDASPSKRV